jgi:hypothetical protein
MFGGLLLLSLQPIKGMKLSSLTISNFTRHADAEVAFHPERLPDIIMDSAGKKIGV